MGTAPLLPRLWVAQAAARIAGAEVLRRSLRAAAEAKEDGSPVTDADRASNRVIQHMLRDCFPADALLSEESADDPARLHAERVWLVDPLDGTREFLARNGEFSILIGLAVDGVPEIGVVYLPATDTLYSAVRGRGAWVERGGRREPLACRTAVATELRLVGSRSHADPLVESLRRRLGISRVVPCGSVGVKCGRIAEGASDLYFHPGAHLREWDTCAPGVVLREAGGTVTDPFGAPLAYNQPVPVHPHGILALAPGCGDQVAAEVRALAAGEIPPDADHRIAS